MPEPRFLNIEYFFNQVFDFFDLLGSALSEDFSVPFLQNIKIFLMFLALLFMVGIVYTSYRINQIRKEEREKYSFIDVAEEPDDSEHTKRWEDIVTKANSENVSDLKLAILEADILLDEMVVKMGHSGENLGERLRNVELSDFNTLSSAWEAHKVRNRIAHEGEQFILTKRETQRVIGLYEKVFQEFKYI